MLKLADAKQIADFFMPHFEPVCEPGYCKVAGGTRREKSFVHDLEFVLKPLDKKPPLAFGVKPKDQPKTLLDVKLNELVQAKVIENTKETRPTSSGRQAMVRKLNKRFAA